MSAEESILKVLRAPLATRWFVNDLVTATGLQTDELYPALVRLERSGLVASGWQGTGFPRRRWYELKGSVMTKDVEW